MREGPTPLSYPQKHSTHKEAVAATVKKKRQTDSQSLLGASPLETLILGRRRPVSTITMSVSLAPRAGCHGRRCLP
jgi:hypothetical protein